MPQNETAPRGRSESTPILTDFDVLHCADQGGYTRGYADGQQANAEDRAHQILHAYARRWTEQAVATARGRHGEGWSQLIRAQAEGRDW
jgi:hypothetical protein